jgi:hypothetical protein
MRGSSSRTSAVRRAAQPNDTLETTSNPAVARAPVSPERADAESRVVGELSAWRVQAMPDADAPLDADDLARLVRSCFDTLGLGGAIGAEFSVNTVHYYRRKDIVDAPAGRTSSARYDVRHVWQAVGARLAGHLGLVTLAEARDVMRGADDDTLVAFAAARVVDARSQARVRESAGTVRAAPVARVVHALEAQARPLPGVFAAPAQASTPVVIPLPGEAWCILPASHPARTSQASARELVEALAVALRTLTP